MHLPVKSVVAALVTVLSAACVASPVSSTTASPTTSLPPTASVTASSSPAASSPPAAYRVLPVPGSATSSPDGRWLVAQGQRDGSPLQLFTIDGTPVREFDAGRFWAWLPDSSGLFVALEIPQRAPPLAILELNGRVTTTDLQLSGQMLSRDGTLIVAQHQEGCCVAIVQREIRVARRDGTGTRTLVSSTVTSEPTPVTLLGIDSADRAVYRDGTNIMRIPLVGGTRVVLATSPDYARLPNGSTSPDGNAILTMPVRGGGWHIIANDRVAAWDGALGVIVDDPNPFPFKYGFAPVWVGPHSFLVRDPNSDSLSTFDAITATRTKQAAQLAPGDMVLAAQRETLLVVRGGFVVLIDLRTGAVRDIGIDLRPSSEAARGAALPTNGFVVSSPAGTFRID
jgi:hypothetical protein